MVNNMTTVKKFLEENPLVDHDLVQGKPDWLAFRIDHDGASEANSALGLSKKFKRTDLLHAKHTRIPREFSKFVEEVVFRKGHDLEALARPIAEAKLGESLFPLTCSRGGLSASCDGLTMDGGIGWEHKQWNKDLAAAVEAGELPDEFMPQPQQCLLVTGAKKWIFTVSDGTEDNFVSMEILPDPKWFKRIIAGWEQFNKDLAVYEPQEYIPAATATPTKDLPAITYQMNGLSLTTNLNDEVKPLIMDLVEASKTPLESDQDFADLEALCKKFKLAEDQCALVAQQAVGEIKDVAAFGNDLKELSGIMRQARLDGEKKVVSEKKARKEAMVLKARTQYNEHVASLQAEIAGINISLLLDAPDFAGAIKGLKKMSAMQEALDNMLANDGKVSADEIAKAVREKLAWCKDNAGGKHHLFPDLQALMAKPYEDFCNTIKLRIAEAEAAAKAEAEAKLKAEEEARLKAEQDSQRGDDQEVAATVPASSAPESASPSPSNPDVVVRHQSEISEFLAERKYKDGGRIHSILVEFVKFQAERQKVAA